MSTPYYLREYQKLLRSLQKRYNDGDEAYHRAVGGNYDKHGQLQAERVLSLAPEGPFTLLDIGCGSGRAATALRDVERLTYFGVDILPELLDFAKQKANRPDWRFETVTDISLPVEDKWADMILVMSVFTHLKPDDITRYISEISRALKPGGVLICSYLDQNHAPHVKAFRPKPLQLLAKTFGRDVTITFTTQEELKGWLEQENFQIKDVITDDSVRQHVMVAYKSNEATPS